MIHIIIIQTGKVVKVVTKIIDVHVHVYVQLYIMRKVKVESPGK